MATESVQTTQTPTVYNYEINQEHLETVFKSVVSSFGGKNLQVENGEDRLVAIINQLLAGHIVTGCKMYPFSKKEDKTDDPTQKTVVISSFLNLGFMGLPQNQKTDVKKVVLSHHMKDKLRERFEELAQQFNGHCTKVNVTKSCEGHVPDFVEKQKNNFVFAKVIVKLPN